MSQMDNIVRANQEKLRKLKIGSHRHDSRADLTASGNLSPTLARLEEYVSTKKPLRKRWILPLFVLMGVGLNMPFAALNGAIVYFSTLFGPTYYVDFLAAFNIPAIPLLTAQLLWDEKMDKKYGSRVTFSFRLILTFMIMATATMALPFVVMSYAYVIGLIAIIGIANGIAFGSIFQLGAIFSSKGPACIFAGLGIGNMITTIILWAIRFDDRVMYDTMVLPLFFFLHGGLTILGIGSIILVMFTRQTKDVLINKDRISRGQDPAYRALLPVNTATDKESPLKSESTWRINLSVLRRTWKSQVSMFLTYFTGVTITSFVAYAPATMSSWRYSGTFTLLALYVNIYGDFIGKNLTFFKSPIKSDLPLLILSVLRACYLAYFFMYLTVDHFPRNDYILLITMGIVAIIGGYLTNLMFTIAPSTCPEYKQQVASMITLVLHIAVYTSIGGSFLLTMYLHFVHY